MPYRDFEKDKPYLVGKFRNPVFDEGTGISNEELDNGVLAIGDAMQGSPHALIKARAFEFICRNMRIDVNPHDYFPAFGCYDRNKRPMRGLLYRWNDEVDRDLIPDSARVQRERNDAGFHLMWKDFDHSVPDWDALYELGFPGLRDRARAFRARHEQSGWPNDDAKALFEGMDITICAVIECIGRFIDYARSHHSGNLRIEQEIECLEQLRIGAPRNTYEVLQLIYLHFMFGEHVDHMQVRSLGNLDRTIYPYFKRDLESGRFTEPQIREMLACFLMQWGSINNYWGHPFYLGGTRADGTSEVNELSYIILDVFDQLAIPTPKIQIKYADNTPAEFLDQALDMIRRGHSSIVFVSEDSIRRIMTAEGFSEETARTCDIFGCYECCPRATCNITAATHINLLKPVELVLNDGADPQTGLRCDCGAARLSQIHSFGDFVEAYFAYLGELIDTARDCSLDNDRHLQLINPALMYSITIENSLKTGRDAYANGSIYNLSDILCAGMGTAVDALMAVKEFVYDRGELSLEAFRDILRGNWRDAPTLRLRILRSKNKYGNGLEKVDRLAFAIMHFFGAKLNLRPNARGGWYQASGHSARTFIIMGEHTGATPDGRFAGDEMSKNLSPAMGADTNGVTALVESVGAIESADLPGDCTLDVMMHPATVQGKEGLTAMRALLFAYARKHGVSIHFNIFDAEVLKDAQRHPMNYEGLQVRVCGWNVRFNDMCKKEQDEYIKRAEQIAE